MSTRRLNPCPFCGVRPAPPIEYEIDGDSYGGFVHAVVCSNCSARGPFSELDDGTSEQRAKAAARVAWNSRH